MRGLCGVPDVPHALSIGSLDPSGDQCVGTGSTHPAKIFIGDDGRPLLRPSSVAGGLGEKENDNNSRNGKPLWITFQLLRDPRALWEAVLIDGKLVLSIPDEGLPEGTKQAITELLEFAEEQLHATAVIVSLNKERPDRAIIIRTLMYLGFESLGPGNQLISPEMNDPQLFYMAYTI